MSDAEPTHVDPSAGVEGFVCAVCAAQDAELVLTGEDRQHGIPGTWSLYHCANCELVQMHPMPAPESIGALYPSDYYAHRSSSGTFREVRVSGVKRFVLRHHYGYPAPGERSSGRGGPLRRALAFVLQAVISKKNLLPWVGTGSLLDVGCGVGSAIWRLRAFGWQVRGVETDAEAAAVGQAAGLEIHAGDLHSARLPDASFDVVRLSHVLEHAPDPLHLLEEIRRILKPDGELWLALPNIDSARFRRFREYWFPLELPRHLFHFSPASLRSCLERAGLRIHELHCHSSRDHLLRSREYERRAAGLPEPRRSKMRRKLRKKWAQLTTWLLDRLGRGDTMHVRVALDSTARGGVATRVDSRPA